MTIIVHEFMQTHFNHLTLRPPLFYAWEYGIRFEISIPRVAHKDKKPPSNKGKNDQNF